MNGHHQKLLDALAKSCPRHLLINKAQKLFFEPLKCRSDSILKLWMEHCNWIVAQRLRRGQQLISHYRKLWKEKELMLFLMRLKKQLSFHTKGMILMSSPFVFDWNKERISNELLSEQMKEMDYVKRLKEGTIYCPECKKRKIIDKKLDNVVYCCCKSTSCASKMDNWEPYLERQNIIIWRKHEGSGQYSYKVYGNYKDVSAEDFFFVQTNVDYRKEWDKTAITLDIVDKDQDPASNNVIIYWEMLWPKLFANRDYVYKRRTLIDRQQHLMIIVNQSTDHPCCPIQPRNQRVNDYWSNMVIRPYSTFRRPGLEFVVTYFDNPGIVIPPTVKTWVAKTHMPDFLNKLHVATVRFAETKKAIQGGVEEEENEFADENYPLLDYFWNYDTDPGFEYPPEREFFVPGLNNNGEKQESRRRSPPDSAMRNDNEQEEEQQQEQATEEAKTEQKPTSWWSYLHPYYYFA